MQKFVLFKLVHVFLVSVYVMCFESDDLRKVMYRAQAMGMTGSDYVYFYYTMFPSDTMVRPWDDGSVMTSEQRTRRIDAFRPVKQASAQPS